MLNIIRKYPPLSIAIAIIAVILIPSLLAGKDATLSLAMIQLTWCGKSDSVCLVSHYICSISIVLALGIVFQILFNWLNKDNKPLKALKILLSAHTEINKNNELYVHIIINNGEDYDIEDCYADVKTIKIKARQLWIDLNDEHIEKYNINPNNAHLTWPAFNKSDNKIVRKGKKGRINIAKYSNGQYLLILEDGDKPMDKFEECQYYIEVTLNGINKLNNKTIKEKEFHGFFRYEKEMMRTTKFYLEPGELPKNINSITDFLSTVWAK